MAEYGAGVYGAGVYGAGESDGPGTVALAGVVPAPVASFVLSAPLRVTLAGTAPAPAAAFTLNAGIPQSGNYVENPDAAVTADGWYFRPPSGDMSVPLERVTTANMPGTPPRETGVRIFGGQFGTTLAGYYRNPDNALQFAPNTEVTVSAWVYAQGESGGEPYFSVAAAATETGQGEPNLSGPVPIPMNEWTYVTKVHSTVTEGTFIRPVFQAPGAVENLYITGLSVTRALANVEVTLARNAPAPIASFALSVGAELLTLAGTAPAPAAAFEFTVEGPPALSLGAVAPVPVADFALTAAVIVTDVSLAGTAPAPAAAFALNVDALPLVPADLSLAGTAPRPVTAFVLGLSDDIVEDVPVDVDTEIAETDPVDQEAHEDDWHPVVPVTLAPTAVAYDSVQAFQPVVVTGTTRASVTVIKREARRAVDRILIKGDGGWFDLTDFRGVRTPTPSWEFIEPFTYGVGTLTIPQIVAVLEDLSTFPWLARGAKVLVQRVDPVTEEVLATDYRARIMDWTINSGVLTVKLGGLFAGPASVKYRPAPRSRRVADVGYWLYAAFRAMRQPLNQVDFGVNLLTRGEGYYYDHAANLCALGVRRSGAQITVAYDDENRRWVQGAKDRDTIHATAYVDDGPMRINVRRDMTDETDEVYATAYLDDGTRLLNSVYPGLQPENPIPEYPMGDGEPFGVGTTNEDTVNGDGIDVMIFRLVVLGLLRRVDQAGGFDVDVAEAIYEFRAQVGRLINPGVGDSPADLRMDEPLWRVLWDYDAAGFTTKEARILPFAQRSDVREWNRSGSGNLIDRNDDYDPVRAALTVSQAVDLGLVQSRTQARRWSRRLLDDGGPNWVGTITTKQGFIRGEHTPGESLGPERIMPNRELRAGMNIWCPTFDGGTLFHIASIGVKHDDDGPEVVLNVDTRARDAMQVHSIVERNRENRRDPARAWHGLRSTMVPKDTIIGHDEHFGILGHDVNVPQGEWTVYEVVSGDYGTVAGTEVRTYAGQGTDSFGDGPAEFFLAVFGLKVTPEWLTARVPNPFDSTDEWWKDLTKRQDTKARRLYYYAGVGEAPLGYWPGQKRAPVTPGANAGPDRNVQVGDTVTLDGSGSSDPDGSITGYSWEQTSGPDVILAGSGMTRTFTPTEPGSYYFALTVTTSGDVTSTDSVHITVTEDPPEDQPDPNEPDPVDAPDGDPLTGRWEDDGSWGFSGPQPLFYVAVYADRDTVVRRGQQFFIQTDLGT